MDIETSVLIGVEVSGRGHGRFEKTQGYCTDLFYSQAIRWMDAKRKEPAPFFAYIALNVAHEPLQCPEEYYKHYEGKVPEKVGSCQTSMRTTAGCVSGLP